MKYSEMNYAHPPALDIRPTWLFLFSLKLFFSFSFFLQLSILLLEEMTEQNPSVQISARLKGALCVCVLLVERGVADQPAGPPGTPGAPGTS